MIQGLIESMKMDEAAKIQIPDEPDASAENVVNLQLRLPDGSKIARRFLRSHTIGDVMNFIKKDKT